MTKSWFRSGALAALTLVGVGVPLVHAQVARQWEPRGFDFSPNGVWRRQAQQVAAARAAAMARGDFALLNSAIAAASGNAANIMDPGFHLVSPLAVTGVLKVPVLLVKFKNTTGTLHDTSEYNQVLLSQTPPAGRPYTVRTFYSEMSHGLLTVQGIVVGWITLDSNDAFYAGSCHALCGSGHMAALIQEAIKHADSTVNFAQFDNDGPDGVPNSNDDDGQVDLVWLIHPKVGAECFGSNASNPNIWSHRFYYSAWAGQVLATSDPSAHGGVVTVDNYTIQSGLGGSTACDANQIMPPGTTAHETGHGLRLPDFYDTNPFDGDNSEGIGEWGLMGSGNYRSSISPSHMESFSLSQLGWVTVTPLTTSGTYQLNPIETGNSAYLVRPTVANPRGEYFLLENRQAINADTGLINSGPAHVNGFGGLLIWHVDSTQYVNNTLPGNSVNTGPIHGLALMQADGNDNLGSSSVSNRGDGGDPYPGSSNNTAFTPFTNPSPRMNSTGGLAGLAIDSITQVSPLGAIAFRLRVGLPTTVRASDTLAQVKVRAVAYHFYQDILNNGDTLTVAVDTFQTSADGRSRFHFVSWSDGGAAAHVATIASAGGTLAANMNSEYRVLWGQAGTGTITASPNTASGTFLVQGDSVTLSATAGGGQLFSGWSGDTTTGNATLKLKATHAFNVVATFAAPLAVADTSLKSGIMGADYLDTLGVAGGTGNYQFVLLSGSIPTGLILGLNDGTIAGTPEVDSTFTFTVRASSGSQFVDLPLRIVVTAPTLATQAVLDQFLKGTSALTTAETRYLDLLGNDNGLLDVGDFTAWLDKTGVVVSADVMQRIMARRPR